MTNWEALAKDKRDSVNALIPKSWLLPSPVPTSAEQRDVTSTYIQQFLTPREIEITETDAVGIVNIIKVFYRRNIPVLAAWLIIVTTQVFMGFAVYHKIFFWILCIK